MPLPSKESMSQRTIIGLGLLAAIAIGGGSALILRNPDEVRVCHRDTCNTYTRTEYNTLKADLVTKWANREELTWEEFQSLVAIMDREAKQRGGIKVMNVRGQGGLRSKISNFLTQ